MSHQPADAEVLAEAIRDKLGEKVNAPGLRALKAVLALQSDASLLQADVTKTFKTTARTASAGTAISWRSSLLSAMLPLPSVA